MKKLLLLLSILLPLSFFIAGCGKEPTTEKNDNELMVYTTVYPLQYFTEKIGGDYVNVKTIYPPGADEHTFEPTQRDMMNLVDADLFFFIGLGLEGFVDKAKETLKNEDVTMVAAAEKLELDEHAESHNEAHEEETEAAHEEEHNHSVDPHVWIDPIYAQELAKTIKDTLIEKMPDQKETFEQNYQKLVADLQNVDKELKETIQSAQQKKIITSHAAYGYWEKRYGLEQISISGLSTSNEPSQKKLEQIVSLARTENLHYIFFEQNVSSKLSEVLKAEIDAEPLTLHNLSTLTKEDIKNKETYFTIMKKNIEALEKALN